MPPFSLLPENAAFSFPLFKISSVVMIRAASFEFLPESIAPPFVFYVLEFPVPPFDFLSEHLPPVFVICVVKFPVPFFEFLPEHPAF
jgi:hypothetical protein